LAPLYIDPVTNLFLYSHHPQGKVWQVSPKLSTTPLRGNFLSVGGNKGACPDSGDHGEVIWEWFNTTTPQGQQLYVADKHIAVKCVDKFEG